jgi:hypothetical protein
VAGIGGPGPAWPVAADLILEIYIYELIHDDTCTKTLYRNRGLMFYKGPSAAVLRFKGTVLRTFKVTRKGVVTSALSGNGAQTERG